MFAVVNIGPREVEMAATAATPRHFRRIFHQDPLKVFGAISNGKQDEMDCIDIINELGFIMAMSARRADMQKLTEADYEEWLTQFETVDLLEASDKIINVYLGNKMTLSELKKDSGQQTGLTQ